MKLPDRLGTVIRQCKHWGGLIGPWACRMIGNLRPRLVPTIITVLMVLILLGLGVWQVWRLEWKNNLIAQITAGQAAPLRDLASVDIGQDPLGAPYHRLSAKGDFRFLNSFILSPRTLDGQTGGFLLTPLYVPSIDRLLLVNRGWVPPNHPVSPSYGRAEDRTVTGVLIPMQTVRERFTPANQPAQGQWHWLDFEALGAAWGVTADMIWPTVLYEDETSPARQDLMELAQGQGDKRYPVPASPPLAPRNYHLSYAITWFTLALAAVMIWLADCLRPLVVVPPPKDAEDEKDDEPSSVRAKRVIDIGTD